MSQDTLERTEHGYNPYTHGCRCGVCREAKAAYVRASRERRHRARRLVQRRGVGRNYVEGITHGYAGYQDYSCRCQECSTAKREYEAIRLINHTSALASGQGLSADRPTTPSPS